MEIEKSSNPMATRDSPRTLLRKMLTVASIAAGLQFGLALQLSLLIPYVQLLGIPHKWASLIWLCGPVSGIIVQPIVGYLSDSSRNRFGRRRPFIVSGAVMVIGGALIIGFAADIGHAAGDSLTASIKTRAISIFVVGFWILDVATNMIQGPCRAFLADLSNGDPNKTRAGNGFFSFFMAVGNILGYAAGSYRNLYKAFPFSKTVACDLYCANLKSCFIIAAALLLILTVIIVVTVPENPPSDGNDGSNGNGGGGIFIFFLELVKALKHLPRSMWILLLVNCLNWLAWFPFLLFDTDWMGREVYGGTIGEKTYDIGVRAGALGLMLNTIVFAFVALIVDFMSRGSHGGKRLWAGVNYLLTACLALTILVSKVADGTRKYGADGQPLPPPIGVKVGALSIFAVLGIPFAVTFSIPFALASIFSSTTSSGAGHGLSLGVLNMSICIPQMIVSFGSGPFDSVFGGGNLPAFVFAAVAAAISATLALTVLPPAPAGHQISQISPACLTN